MVIFLEKMKIGTCKVYQGNSSKAPGPLFVMCFFIVAGKAGGSLSLMFLFGEVHSDL